MWWNNMSVVQSCAQSSSFFSTASSSSFDSQFSLVLGSSWRHGEGAVAFRAGYSCTTRIAPTSGSKGRRCNRGDTARGCWGSIRTRCTSPPRAPPHRVFFGGDSAAFFRRVVCAVERNSTHAHRSCLLIGPSAPL
jgi:hypothetical protein